MAAPHDLLLRKLAQHSLLAAEDEESIHALTFRIRELAGGEDLIRQGEKSTVSAVVLSGMLARYHTLSGGRRQYLSFHLAGDWADAQTLLLETIDHGVCAIGEARLATVQHDHLVALFTRRPSIGFAVWRETLIDAALFREAITNNCGRSANERMAHLFFELYYRARAAGLTRENTLAIPLTQAQIGEALGMALVSVNRTIQVLRRSGTMDFRNGVLTVHDAPKLATIADFDPTYLHGVPLKLP